MIANPHHHDHRAPTLFQRPDVLGQGTRCGDPLYVITPVINACRWRNRWKHYEDFRKRIAEAGAILYTVEVAFGDRAFVVTDPANPHDVQLRTWHELWMKERAINVGTGVMGRQNPDWRYVAWIDADCLFVRPDWADETRHLLQHWPLVQMWSQLHYLNHHYELLSQAQSFMSLKLLGDRGCPTPDPYAYYLPYGPKWGAPGLAWAARREAWDQMGGLLDCCILGSGDWYFALCCMGELDKGRHGNDLTDPFWQAIKHYESRIAAAKWQERPLTGNVGMMRGLVLHFWHGSRANRRFPTRGTILAKHRFDPNLDLKPDWSAGGLWQLTDHTPELRREIAAYFAARDEDATS